MTLKQVEPIKLDRNKVGQVLEEAAEREFETVFVLGLKDRTISVMMSGSTNNLEVLGALEMAKQHLWDNS